jgi:hypothetical protein
VQSAKSLAQNILGRRDVPVVFWDERLSTAGAERALLDADINRAKRDEVIDMVDADDAQLLPVPDASATAAHLYAASILALKGEILLVLDVDRVVDAVRGSAKSAA